MPVRPSAQSLSVSTGQREADLPIELWRQCLSELSIRDTQALRLSSRSMQIAAQERWLALAFDRIVDHYVRAGQPSDRACVQAAVAQRRTLCLPKTGLSQSEPSAPSARQHRAQRVADLLQWADSAWCLRLLDESLLATGRPDDAPLRLPPTLTSIWLGAAQPFLLRHGPVEQMASRLPWLRRAHLTGIAALAAHPWVSVSAAVFCPNVSELLLQQCRLAPPFFDALGHTPWTDLRTPHLSGALLSSRRWLPPEPVSVVALIGSLPAKLRKLTLNIDNVCWSQDLVLAMGARPWPHLQALSLPRLALFDHDASIFSGQIRWPCVHTLCVNGQWLSAHGVNRLLDARPALWRRLALREPPRFSLEKASDVAFLDHPALRSMRRLTWSLASPQASLLRKLLAAGTRRIAFLSLLEIQPSDAEIDALLDVFCRADVKNVQKLWVNDTFLTLRAICWLQRQAFDTLVYDGTGQFFCL